MTEEKPYNTDLMLAVREQIREHPEQHDQAYWAQKKDCGTTLCIAGWAAVLSGRQVEWLDDEDVISVWLEGDEGLWGRMIPDAARELLGLDYMESIALFMQRDNAAALELLDRMIVAGKNGERVTLE